MNLKNLLDVKPLVAAYKDKPRAAQKAAPFKAVSKYKCKMNRIKYLVLFGEEYCIIQNKDMRLKLTCSDIKKVTIHERLWSIRVKVQCINRKYAFDFPSYKLAHKFYEQLIYAKVNKHIH